MSEPTPNMPVGRWSAVETIGRGVRAAPALRTGLGLTLLLAMVGAAGRVVIPILIQQAIDRGFKEDAVDVAIVTWLAGPESKDVTGRIFQVSGRELAVAEGWHKGPAVTPTDDPTEIGPLVAELMANARPNADMFGNDKK